MKLNTFAAAIAVAAASAIAAPAVAQGLTAGQIQLSHAVGVEPGTLTLAQLVQLDQAQREGGVAGQAKAAFILASAGSERVSTSGSTSSDTNRAILLERAQHESNDFLIAQLSKSATSTTAADRDSLAPGKVQLAASLNVNPADYTTAELVSLQTARTFADNAK